MTFSDLRSMVSYHLDDLNFGYFTQVQINLWLNNAQKEVQKRLIKLGQNFYTKTVSTQTIVDCRAYSLPIDFKKLHRLDLVISGTLPNESVQSLTPCTWNQQDLVSPGRGTPKVYAIQRNKLVLFPAPDTALTMRLTYSYLVSDMTLDTDVPDVPADYHELLALMAAQDGFIKDARVSETLLKKMAEYEADMETDANERRQDLSREIRETGDSASGGFF